MPMGVYNIPVNGISLASVGLVAAFELRVRRQQPLAPHRTEKPTRLRAPELQVVVGARHKTSAVLAHDVHRERIRPRILGLKKLLLQELSPRRCLHPKTRSRVRQKSSQRIGSSWCESWLRRVHGRPSTRLPVA